VDLKLRLGLAGLNRVKVRLGLNSDGRVLNMVEFRTGQVRLAGVGYVRVGYIPFFGDLFNPLPPSDAVRKKKKNILEDLPFLYCHN